MTCIAAVVQNDELWMGGDSAGVGGLYLELRRDPKVFQVGPFLIGYTSSFRMGQILRFGEEGHKLSDAPLLYGTEKTDAYEVLVTKLVPWIRERFKAAGYARKEHDVESGGCFLVGFRGRLFTVQSDYQVGEPLDSFAAIGCGADLALGALHATDPANSPGAGRGKVAPSANDRIHRALSAAERFSAGVRGPFTILRMEAAT